MGINDLKAVIASLPKQEVFSHKVNGQKMYFRRLSHMERQRIANVLIGDFLFMETQDMEKAMEERTISLYNATKSELYAIGLSLCDSNGNRLCKSDSDIEELGNYIFEEEVFAQFLEGYKKANPQTAQDEAEGN